MSANLRQANRGAVIALGGGSNVAGPSRTGEVALTLAFPAWLTWVRNGVETSEWPTNFGVVVGIAHGLSLLGHTSPLTIVERGLAGSSISGWATGGSPIIDTLISDAATAAVRPVALCTYVGSVDAGTPALAAAARANIQDLVETARSAWGAGCGAILGGLHTPEAGIVEDEDEVDDALLAFANAHSPALCAYFRNRDAQIQGGGSDHLSGGDAGGAILTGMRYAQILWDSGVVR